VNSALVAEIQSLGGDAGDPVWQWFILRGPHGPHFTWGQTRKEPSGYVGVEHLQQTVYEKEESDPSFSSRARDVIHKAFSSKNPNFLRRAVQVAAVIGGEAELELVSALTSHEDKSVAADARASAFHLRKKLGGKRE
jgi:hypothetical protein